MFIPGMCSVMPSPNDKYDYQVGRATPVRYIINREEKKPEYTQPDRYRPRGMGRSIWVTAHKEIGNRNGGWLPSATVLQVLSSPCGTIDYYEVNVGGRQGFSSGGHVNAGSQSLIAETVACGLMRETMKVKGEKRRGT